MAGSREAFDNLLTDEQLSRIRDALSAPPTAPAAASPADRPSASNVSLGGSHPNSSRTPSRPRPAVRSTEEEVRAIFRPARTFTSNFTRTRLFACASYLTSRHSANSLSIVMKVDTLISGYWMPPLIQISCQLARASAGNFKYSDVTCFCDSLGPGWG